MYLIVRKSNSRNVHGVLLITPVLVYFWSMRRQSVPGDLSALGSGLEARLILHSHRHKVAGQLTLARTNLLTKLLCEHAQIEPSRAESSLISPLSNSEPEWGLTRVSVPRVAV